MADEDTSQTPAPATEPTTTPEAAIPPVAEPEPMQSESVTETPPISEPQTAHLPVDEPFPSQAEASPAPTQGVASLSVVTPRNINRELLVKAHAVTQERKQKKLERIMALFVTQSQITNDEVERLLHVSDATATRYLSLLGKDGKIKQIGKTGRGVAYEKA